MVKYIDFKQRYPVKYGELYKQVTEDLVHICKLFNKIVIYGHTKSGKVIIGRTLAEKLNCKLITSDDYQFFDFYENMYLLRDLVKMSSGQFILEGIQTARILRKGVEHGDFFADLVIELNINYESLKYCYIQDGEQDKLKNNKVYNFNYKMLDKVYEEWKENQNKEYPYTDTHIIRLNTSFL